MHILIDKITLCYMISVDYQFCSWTTKAAECLPGFPGCCKMLDCFFCHLNGQNKPSGAAWERPDQTCTYLLKKRGNE